MLLSVKTVQFHLTRVYTKLGVRSRSELAARFSREPALHEDGGPCPEVAVVSPR
jgi:DNA-binding NarL/FixJ family response regulator